MSNITKLFIRIGLASLAGATTLAMFHILQTIWLAMSYLVQQLAIWAGLDPTGLRAALISGILICGTVIVIAILPDSKDARQENHVSRNP